jgi:hypothetical protein
MIVLYGIVAWMSFDKIKARRIPLHIQSIFAIFI